MKILEKAILGIVLSGVIAQTGCLKKDVPSLFDPNAQSRPQPHISAIIPPDSALGGVGVIIIQGDNFSEVPGENLVFFNGTLAEVISASSQELRIKSPQLVGDSIRIKIAVHLSEFFSNTVLYKLLPAVVEFGKLEGAGQDSIEAFGLAVDAAENVYVALAGKLIRKIAPDGKTSLFASTSFLKANGMKIGPGGILYTSSAAGRLRKLSQFAPDGSESTFTTFTAAPGDFDFDNALNIWIAVANDIYLVKPDKSKAQIDSYPSEIRAVRVFEGNLYVLAGNADNSEQKIWRSAIQGETLGAKEVFLDGTAASWLDGAAMLSFTFSAAGDLMLGTSHRSGLFIYRADGSHDGVYPGLFTPSIIKLAWGNQNFLYALRQTPGSGTNLKTKVLKIDLAGPGAPYYGRQ